ESTTPPLDELGQGDLVEPELPSEANARERPLTCELVHPGPAHLQDLCHLAGRHQTHACHLHDDHRRGEPRREQARRGRTWKKRSARRFLTRYRRGVGANGDPDELAPTAIAV